jgi:hypothetical protein
MNRTHFVQRLSWSSLAACGLIGTNLSAAQGADPAVAPKPANLGVQDYESPGVQVVLFSVKRGSDGYVTVRWGYHNTTSRPQNIGANTGAMSGAWSGPYSLAWDFYVTAGDTKYATADGGGGKLAASHGPNKVVVVGPKQTLATWAKVKDPGKDVKTVTVYVQGAAPFDDIPIS